jgi:hypothetical protein
MTLASTTLVQGTAAYAAEEEESVTQECVDKITESMHSQAAKLDEEKAIRLASDHSEFESRTGDFKREFNSIFNRWTIDTTDCSADWQTVNVVYSLYNDTGYVKNVVFTEDPELTKVIEVSEHVGKKFGGAIASENWSGYEFKGSSSASTFIYEAKATWSVPEVSEPEDFFCFFAHCDVSTWPGLADTAGATNDHLAQAGTNSGIYCTAGCSFYYYAWYEFLPAASVDCMDVNADDSITTTVTNKAKTGGSSSRYDISVVDTTISESCSVTNHLYSAMTAPKYAPFISERPTFFGGLSRLPEFDSVTMSSGSIYYSGSSKSISTPYSNGWYNEYVMLNDGNENIDVGGVSGGTFTQTYLTSDGT